jgi:hypothetical protein
MIGIYKISSPTNRIYIGQSKNLETRFKNQMILNLLLMMVKDYLQFRESKLAI